MVDVAGAREEIQKVVAFLVSKHGSETDVFNHLTLALSHLQEAPPIVEETVAVPEPEPPEEAATIEPELDPWAEEPAELEIEVSPEPAPKKARRQRRR